MFKLPIDKLDALLRLWLPQAHFISPLTAMTAGQATRNGPRAQR